MSDEREAIARWLRDLAKARLALSDAAYDDDDAFCFASEEEVLSYAADAIQRGDHLAPKE